MQWFSTGFEILDCEWSFIFGNWSFIFGKLFSSWVEDMYLLFQVFYSCQLIYFNVYIGLPWWLSSIESACQFRRLGFSPWVRKIPESKKRQPTPDIVHGISRVAKGWTRLTNYTTRTTTDAQPSLLMVWTTYKKINKSPYPPHFTRRGFISLPLSL